MGDVVNLRQARKARKRADAEATARGNRAKFGQTLDERIEARAHAERTAKTLDGARRDPE
ncbi:MAG TPA: DUF4169 family protein [Novosphingobium sp.]|nr:DUF4169 family protein [Novosphingobium sp.]